MARISTYPIDAVVDTTDLLIGTDSEDSNKTKNYTIASIIALAELSIDLEEVLSVGNTATNNINLTGILTATTVNGTNGTIGTFGSTTGTIDTLISTNGTIVTLGSTTGTIVTLNSTTGTIDSLVSTVGNIATLNSVTGTIDTLNSTTGTIDTLNSTTGTIDTLNSTTGTIDTLNSTSAFLDTATVDTLGVTIGITNALLYIDSLNSSGTVGQVLTSTGTATEWGDNGMSSWIVTGGNGGPQTITNGGTVNFVGGTYITTTTSVATNTLLTIDHDATARTDTPLTPSALAYGDTFTAITSATTNATGHVTATDITTYQLPLASSRGYMGARAQMAGQTTSLPIITQWYPLNYILGISTGYLWSTELDSTSNWLSRIRYNGPPLGERFNITVTFTINGFPVGDLVYFALYNTSVLIAGSQQRIQSSSSNFTTGTLQAMQYMNNGDYIEVWAKAASATTIVAVDYLTISAVPV